MLVEKRLISIIMHNDLNDLLEISLENWNGKIFKIPREFINNSFNDKINHPGVYFLICENNNDLNSIYIGETENIIKRLNQHIQKKTYYWNFAFVLIGHDLDKGSLRYIERKFYDYFNEIKTYKILTKLTTNDPILSNYRKCSCDEYIRISIDVLKTLGLSLNVYNYKYGLDRVKDFSLQKNISLTKKQNKRDCFRKKIRNDPSEWDKYFDLNKPRIKKILNLI